MFETIRATGKGVYWTALVVLFGLAQLWVIVGYSLYSFPEKVTFYSMTKDGVLLFFTLAVTISVTMDFWFNDEKLNTGKLWKATAFAFYPMLIMGFVIASFSIISFGNLVEQKEIVNMLSIGSILLTLLYAIIGKAYLFKRTKSFYGGLRK